MKDRCYNTSSQHYNYYGARGIDVQSDWIREDGFENFLNDMGFAPEGLTLERIDNNKGYSKSNCKWATWLEQSKNKRQRNTA